MRGRFYSLDETHSKCESTLMEIMSFCPQNQVKTKKKNKVASIMLRNAHKENRRAKSEHSFAHLLFFVF